MAARIITYELKNPSEKTNYEAFHQVVRGYDHIVLSDSAYAIATDEYPKDIFEKLFALIDPEDSLTVIALVRFYMAHHDKGVLQWLDANVQRLSPGPDRPGRDFTDLSPRLHRPFTPVRQSGRVISRLKTLLAGDAAKLAGWTGEANSRWTLTCLAVFVGSCAVYGATFGLWRSETQALATAVKFPLVVLLTCAGNALLNGSLALALGAGLGFRQSALAILMSFTIMGLILASFAPLMVFLFANVPSIRSADATTGQHLTLLAHVGLIAFAGIVGNRRLWQMLRHLTGTPGRAHLILIAWLAGNLLLGSQISWILRPWIGRAGQPVHFFSPEPLRGNFFEAVWTAAHHLLSS